MIYWIFFGIIMVLIPIGVIGLRRWAERQQGIEAPKWIKLWDVRFIVFYWLCDLFYMTCFQHYLIWQFILGIVIIAVVFYNLAKIFSSVREKNGFETFGMIQDFLIGIGLTIYLLYLIPNEHLRNIMVPVIAAVYGGLLTLSGVAWTIRKGESNRKEEEKKKHKPLVFLQSFQTLGGKKTIPINVFEKENLVLSNGIHYSTKKEDKNYWIHQFYLYNTDYSFCSFKGFMINEDSILAEIGQVLDKEKIYAFFSDIRFTFDQEIKFFGLILQDMLENTYVMELKIRIVPAMVEGLKEIRIESGIEIKEIKQRENKINE